MSVLKTATIARNGRPIPPKKPPPELVSPCRYCLAAERTASDLRRRAESAEAALAVARADASAAQSDARDLRRRLEVIRLAATKSERELRRMVLRLASKEHEA